MGHRAVEQRHEHAAVSTGVIVQQLWVQCHRDHGLAAFGAFDLKAEVLGEGDVALWTAARPFAVLALRARQIQAHAFSRLDAAAAAVKSRGPVNARPPSTGMTAPVMYEPQSLASSMAMRLMSSMRPRRFSGTRCAMAFIVSSVGARRFSPSVSAIGPGTMELMRMPCAPHSSASTCVSMSTPALAAHTWAWKGVGMKAWPAEIWITQAPGLRKCACASRATLKLPSRSMSTTVLKALGDMSTALARKL